MKVKFRTAYDDVRYNKPTSFDEVVDEWKYSSELGYPVVVGKVNLQEQIQQYADCALDKVLKKFLTEEEIPQYLGELGRVAQYVDAPEGVVEEQPNYDDMLTLANLYEKAEVYRAQFGLPDSLTVSEIYKVVGEYAGKLGKSLNELSKNKAGEEDEGGLENETNSQA